MNTTIHIPFSTIQINEATQKQLTYLRKIFFTEGSDEAKSEFTIEVHFKKILHPEKYVQLEESCISTEDSFYILDSQKNLLSLNLHVTTAKLIRLSVDPDFDLYQLFNVIIEPLILIWSAYHKRLYLHASGVVTSDQQAHLFTAWQNTGKTQSVLQLTRDDAMRFIGDDFCVVAEKNVYLYPKSINLFSYNFKRFPDVFANIPWSERLRIKSAMLIQQLLYRLSFSSPFPFSKIFFRMSELAEIASNFRATPADLKVSVSDKAVLSSVSLLEKSNQQIYTSKKPLPIETAQIKLLAIIEYELRDFFSLYKQYKYCFPDNPNKIIESFSKNYNDLIKNELSGVQVVPFTKKTDLREFMR